MKGYYLGDEVEVVETAGRWVWACFAKDRRQKRWRMWADQIKAEPWGDKPYYAKQRKDHHAISAVSSSARRLQGV